VFVLAQRDVGYRPLWLGPSLRGCLSWSPSLAITSNGARQASKTEVRKGVSALTRRRLKWHDKGSSPSHPTTYVAEETEMAIRDPRSRSCVWCAMRLSLFVIWAARHLTHCECGPGPLVSRVCLPGMPGQRGMQANTPMTSKKVCGP
jgi:hypothetical protein